MGECPTRPIAVPDAVTISVVVPVYNVSDYVDECLASLHGQTFGDFEVLLIDDGSTDDSADKCASWVARDDRMRLIRQQNGGVSAARNRGIEEASGEYLAFVDPDDWVDERYLEVLITVARESGADFVECDLWRYSNRSGEAIRRSCGSSLGVEFTLEEHMKYGPTASYKSISRRSLWIANEVRFPACAFESPAVYALVLALANKVAYVPEALYWYRRFRENSLIETGYAQKDGTPNNTLGIEAMEHLLGQFEKRGLTERFADVLPGVVAYRLNDILAMQHHRKSSEDFKQTVANFRAFLTRAFPQVSNAPYITWGGYNLGKALTHMDRLHDPTCRFSFSSLASVVGSSEAVLPLSHRNRYRQMMLEREQSCALWDTLSEFRPPAIVLDLMEERFDLVECEGRILTKSDAFEEALARSDAQSLPPMRTIARNSEEARAIWEQSCDAFFARLCDIVPGIRVIVVEDYLAERVGDLSGQRDFEDLASIRASNEVLAGYYRYIRQTQPEAVFVDLHDDTRYFTDAAYEYGAIPSHLNSLVNRAIAKAVEEVLP